ncbi:hypothetical protein DL764_001805 [Monosporascus ibericus]|uniref:Uncharacterized protein n=1 Tax=Monosporascus ibericus TaxID=155417 RepID=A0A4Q4TSJ4_9PEZI|nr:hypothetical protein DL764_001805 [Monosporascus ibericus]
MPVRNAAAHKSGQSPRDDDEELDTLFDDDDEGLDTSWDDDPALTIAVERVKERPQRKEFRWPTKKRPPPPSIFEHIVMKLCRDVPPGGRMQQTILRRISKCMDRVRRPSEDTIYLSLFRGGELARKESILRGTSLDRRIIFKMIANVSEYTRKIQKARATMLEDLACRNIAIALRRTEELRILKPDLEAALLHLLKSRRKSLKFDTGDFNVALDLMRLTSRMRDEYRQALMGLQEPHVGSTGGDNGLGHPYEKPLSDANSLLRRSVQWLVEAGLVRMELKIRLFDVFWEQVEIINTRAENRRWSLKLCAAAPAHKRGKKENEGES